MTIEFAISRLHSFLDFFLIFFFHRFDPDKGHLFPGILECLFEMA